MKIPELLKRKYSWGTIPQWEIDLLKARVPDAPDQEKRRGRPPKVSDGDQH